MALAKKLICGITAVGSISTVAIVASQYGTTNPLIDRQQSENNQQTQISNRGDSIQTTTSTLSIEEEDSSDFSNSDTQLDEDDSKNSKEDIEKWLKSDDGGNSKFKIKIRKSKNNETDLGQTEKNDLTGLLSYLKEEKDTLLKLIKDSNTDHLTFKKDDDQWNVIHNETTINNWINNTSQKKSSLKLWENYSEKTLSKLESDDEFKKLFKALKNKENLFSNASKDEIIVFERYCESWKHIKDIFKESLTWSEDKVKEIKIKKEGSEILIENAHDDDLTGLFEHLQTKDNDDDDDYNSAIARKELVLKKKNDKSNQWEKITK